MGALRQILVVAGLDLRRRVRNRSALVTAFVGPLAMALVFGSLFSGVGAERFRIAVVDLDRSETSAELVSALAEPDGVAERNGDAAAISFVAFDDEPGARDAMGGGDADAALLITEGFGDSVSGGTAASLVVLRDPEKLISGQVAQSVAASIGARFERLGHSIATVSAMEGRAPDAELIAAATDQGAALAAAEVPVGGRDLSPSAYFGAAMSILFLFFTVGFAARSVLLERQTGTLDRMLATATGPGAIIAGKTLAVSALGLAGFVTVWAVTSLVFGDNWGPPLAVLALMVATVVAIGGVATFVASLARSERQADAATSAVTFVLALLGGNFVGPNQPPLLRRLSVLTPNGWSLRAFADLNADAGDLISIAPALAILVAMGAVFGAIGAGRVRRVMLR